MPFRDSAYTNPDMNEALYQDPENSLLLAEYALATGGIQLGAISANLGASNPLVTDPVLDSEIETNCPRPDQYTLVRGRKGLPIAKRVRRLAMWDMLFNPTTNTFHAIDALEIVHNEAIWMIATGNEAVSFSSRSHPIIRSWRDRQGTPISSMRVGWSVLTWNISNIEKTKATTVTNTGEVDDVMRIHMRDGHIYAVGNTPERLVVCHNNKQLPL